MKSLRFNLALLTFAAVFSIPLFGCGKDSLPPENGALQVNKTIGASSINLGYCQANINNLPTESLTEEEIKSLQFMREEEKLARDVYEKMNSIYRRRVFENIRSSEETHMSAVLQLLNKYQIVDPVGLNPAGKFTNPTLQNLYDNLLVDAKTGIIEAFRTGALIEETDIKDLKAGLQKTNNQDIKFVYENLLRASGNHLRAFVRNIDNSGFVYTPQILTKEEFDTIINNTW